MKNVFASLLIALSLVACGGSDGPDTPDTNPPVTPTHPPVSEIALTGKLIERPEIGGFDFLYLPQFVATRQAFIGGQQLRFQARFTYEPDTAGDQGRGIGGTAHSLISVGQANDPNIGMVNRYGQVYWSSAVGIFVSPKGLEMERWFMDNGRSNAYVWNQVNRCRGQVHNGNDLQVDCIGEQANAMDVLTSAPDFVMRAGVTYTLQMTLTSGTPESPSSQSLLTLGAVLYEDVCESLPCSMKVVQSGRKTFPIDAIWPTDAPLNFAVARTPGGTASVAYEASGF